MMGQYHNRARWLLVIVVLALPALACGFPLAVGGESASLPEVVCAETESAESCQLRADAYALMSTVQSARVDDLVVHLLVNPGTGYDSVMEFEGMYALELQPESEGAGFQMALSLDHIVMQMEDKVDYTGEAKAFVDDSAVYTYMGDYWERVEITSADDLDGIHLITGLLGADAPLLSLYRDPTWFTVTTGDPVEIGGQTMIVQTLAIDLPAMAYSGEALRPLIVDWMDIIERLGLSVEEMGLTEDQAVLAAAMMLPFMTGTEATTTLYIGADDGLIHYFDEQVIFDIRIDELDPELGRVQARYSVSGFITRHNERLGLAPPGDFVEGDSSWLFGIGGSEPGLSDIFGGGN